MQNIRPYLQDEKRRTQMLSVDMGIGKPSVEILHDEKMVSMNLLQTLAYLCSNIAEEFVIYCKYITLLVHLQ